MPGTEISIPIIMGCSAVLLCMTQTALPIVKVHSMNTITMVHKSSMEGHFDKNVFVKRFQDLRKVVDKDFWAKRPAIMH